MINLKFILADCHGDIAAAQTRIDRTVEKDLQLKEEKCRHFFERAKRAESRLKLAFEHLHRSHDEEHSDKDFDQNPIVFRLNCSACYTLREIEGIK